ncbi:MAG: hypothetical protein QM731_05110 [Chitinophagaceae bacterium]
MKNIYKLSAIVSVFFCSLLLLFVLIKASDNPNTLKNGFVRNIFPFVPQMVGQTRLSNPLTGICGNTDTHVYFSGKTPNEIIVTDFSLGVVDTFYLRLPFTQRTLLGFDVFIDSPTVNVFSRNEATFLQYRFNDSNAFLKKLPMRLFTRVIPMNSPICIFRTFGNNGFKQNFQKINVLSGKVIGQCSDTLMGKQTDAGFSTDGLLQYDDFTKKLVYIQYYDNRFWCMDTSLQLLYIGHTIDTVQFNKVKVRNSLSEDRAKKAGSIMPSAPLKSVNSASITYKGKLFILSSLQADNEKKGDFENNSVIDIYNVIDGKYQGSFYIPKKNGDNPSEFKIIKDQIFVLNDNSITAFSLKYAPFL